MTDQYAELRHRLSEPRDFYPDTDPRTLPAYDKHVFSMTAAGLHEKSDIAAQLALRDRDLATLLHERDALKASLAERTQQIGVACSRHDLTHSLACGRCHKELLAERDALRAEMDDAREELQHVLRDWNEIKQAIGSLTNGGLIGHANALRAVRDALHELTDSGRWYSQQTMAAVVAEREALREERDALVEAIRVRSEQIGAGA